MNRFHHSGTDTEPRNAPSHGESLRHQSFKCGDDCLDKEGRTYGAACLPHETAVSKLEQGYGEQRVGLGIGPSGGAVYELYVADTGTWTILVTRPNGLSCIAASGESWMTSPLLAGDPT